MMVEVLGHPDLGDSPNHIIGAARRVGQYRDALAPPHQCAEAFEGAGHRRYPVMNHAPKVEDEPVVIRRYLAHSGDQLNTHSPPKIAAARRLELLAAWRHNG